MTFEQIRQYIKGVINGIDFNSHISPMPAEDMSEVVSPLPSVMSRRMKYSTEEQIIGEWIDGKPIYQKTYALLILTQNTWNTLPHNITNLDKVVDYYGACYVMVSANLYRWIKFGCTIGGDDDYSLYAQVTTDSIMTFSGKYTAWGTDSYGYVTVQYTKTTD